MLRSTHLTGAKNQVMICKLFPLAAGAAIVIVAAIAGLYALFPIPCNDLFGKNDSGNE